jgi:hypothetical protein
LLLGANVLLTFSHLVPAPIVIFADAFFAVCKLFLFILKRVLRVGNLSFGSVLFDFRSLKGFDVVCYLNLN